MMLSKANIWTRATLLAAPVLAVQVAVTQVQSDLGVSAMGSALAQDRVRARGLPKIPELVIFEDSIS